MERTIEVGMNDYGTARAPDILSSGGVGPCIAVGAINNDRAYMFHVVPMQNFRKVECVRTFFDELRAGVTDKRKVKMYVAGGQISVSPDEPEEVLRELHRGRSEILEIIREEGYSPLVEWCKEGKAQELLLYPASGTGVIEYF